MGVVEDKTYMEKFFSKQEKIDYRSGDLILSERNSGRYVFYIWEGFVKVFSTSLEGKEKVHLIYGKGDFFPLLTSLGRSTKRHINFEALGPVELSRGMVTKFKTFLNTDPTILLEVVERLINFGLMLSSRMENLEMERAYDRVAARLLSLANWFTDLRSGEETVVIRIPLHHKDIANSVNLSRETVSRELNKMIRQGLIDYTEDSFIVLKDWKKVREELEQRVKIESLLVSR